VVEPASNVTTSSSGGLPLTGSDIKGLSAVGAGGLVVGGWLVRRSRHARATE
jgi:LPXTG-motif cell wall-anchored protein